MNANISREFLFFLFFCPPAAAGWFNGGLPQQVQVFHQLVLLSRRWGRALAAGRWCRCHWEDWLSRLETRRRRGHAAITDGSCWSFHGFIRSPTPPAQILPPHHPSYCPKLFIQSCCSSVDQNDLFIHSEGLVCASHMS